MSEERREREEKKFFSGKAYKENQTDFSAFLKPVIDDDVEEENIQQKSKEKPKNYQKKEEEKDYSFILKQAMEDSDDDFDELEDGFEEEVIKINNEKIPEVEEITKSSDVIKEKNVNNPLTTSEDSNTQNIENKEIDQQEKTVASLGNEENESTLPNNTEEKDESILSDDNDEEYEDEEEPSLTLDEIMNAPGKNSDLVIGKGENMMVAFGNINEVERKGTIGNKFIKNPPSHLIDGHDFNEPYLDGVYFYDYPEYIKEIRARKEKERQEKIQKRLEEEAKLDELKKERQKKEEKKRKNKSEKVSSKPKKELKVPDKYPIEYLDPSDEEIDEKTGKPYYYFNFEKTILYGKLWWLAKIIPVKAINEVLYDKGFLDGVADRQHEHTVKLNNMTAAEQYSRDLRNTGILIGLATVLFVSIFAKLTMSIIPDKKYNEAMNNLNNKQYENCYYQFTELGNKELSVYYAKYSEAKMYFKTEKYAEAKEAFTLLLPYQEDVFKPIRIDIQQEINECDYQIALNYYYSNDYESAKNIFEKIYNYSDSTEKYYECGYKIAKDLYETWQDNEDLKKALRYFYKIRNYSNSDTTEYIDLIQETLYGNALNYYNQKQYADALDIYSYLALFNYTSSDGTICSEMVSQCTYRYGLDLYKNRQYESARKTLLSIADYKDSYVLMKECIFNIADILYENNPVASISQYQQIEGYKTADERLYSPRVLPYGKWQITEMNGSSITPIDFRFYDDGQLFTDNQIMSVAISTAASPQIYEWNDSEFIAQDGKYSLSCSFDKETNRMSMTCVGPNSQTTYTCKRLMSYEELISSEDMSNMSETAEETLNQKFKNLIQEYIDKKIDGSVVQDGENKQIFSNDI